MAIRIPVDGKMETATNMNELVNKNPASSYTAEYKDGNVKIVSPDKAKNIDPSLLESMNKNQSNIIQGIYSDPSTRKKYLNMEIPHINNWLLGFRFKDPNIRPEIVIEDNYNWVAIKKFPLPNDYNRDYEDIIIVTASYPDFGPVGIHISDSSPNKTKIMSKMGGGHVYNRETYTNYEKPYDLGPGYTWVCFHYDGWDKWNFNKYDFMQGDNLTKYIKNVFANMSGNYDI